MGYSKNRGVMTELTQNNIEAQQAAQAILAELATMRTQGTYVAALGVANPTSPHAAAVQKSAFDLSFDIGVIGDACNKLSNTIKFGAPGAVFAAAAASLAHIDPASGGIAVGTAAMAATFTAVTGGNPFRKKVKADASDEE
jgi:hypothetical protein